MAKRFVCLLALLLLASGTLFAQDLPKSDLYLGYSFARVSPQTSGVGGIDLHGGSFSVSWNARRHFGLVADFGGYHGAKTFPAILAAGSPQVAAAALTNNLDGTIYTYMFGPRFTYRNSENSQRVTPFVQVLFGGAHASADILGTSSSQNTFAMSAGGGFDVKLVDRVSWRLVQAEFLLTRFDETGAGRVSQHNARISTGIVFHF
jgi:hypothetical protein